MLSIRPYQGRPEKICCSSETRRIGTGMSDNGKLREGPRDDRQRSRPAVLQTPARLAFNRNTRSSDVGKRWTINTCYSRRVAEAASIIAAIRQLPSPTHGRPFPEVGCQGAMRWRACGASASTWRLSAPRMSAASASGQPPSSIASSFPKFSDEQQTISGRP
jgi:hypothetical protein